MTGLVERVRNAISPCRTNRRSASPPAGPTRSPYSNSDEGRGRTPRQQPYTTGRGGAGNIIKSGAPVDPNELSTEEDKLAWQERSRRAFSPQSHGRGGTGNIRSPSRDAADRAQEDERLRELDEEDRRVKEAYDEQTRNTVHSTGRGGAGNIH